MATDRDKLMRGVRFMAIGFPFIFIGPSLMFWLGIPLMHRGNYWWLIISILLMGVAAFFCVKGLLTILAGLFHKERS